MFFLQSLSYVGHLELNWPQNLSVYYFLRISIKIIQWFRRYILKDQKNDNTLQT